MKAILDYIYAVLYRFFVGIGIDNIADLASWVTIVTGILVIAAGVYGLAKFFYNKLRFMRPVKASYLIPQAKYPFREFPGAPSQEKKVKKLVVGVGQYYLINELRVSTNAQVDPFVLSFEGSSQNKPTIDSVDNPFVIESTVSGGIKYRKDWWGNIHRFSPEMSTSNWYREPRIMGHRITTVGAWKGKTCITIPINGVRAYILKLDLEVSEQERCDQIPFLKT